MAWYGKKECTREDIEWFVGNSQPCPDEGCAARIMNLDDQPLGYQVHFEEDGFALRFGGENGFFVPWSQTWAFANIFYGAKRVMEFLAMARRLQKPRVRKDPPQPTASSKPGLYLVEPSVQDRRKERKERQQQRAVRREEKTRARREKAQQKSDG